MTAVDSPGSILGISLWMVLATLWGPARAQPGPGEPLRRLVSVTGAGEVQGKPDTAHIQVGVVSESETAQAAVEQNNRAMAQLLDVLREHEVPERNIQTTSFNISPQYRQDRPRPEGGQPHPRIIGYQVVNQVRVKVEALSRLGTILDAVVRAGANQIHGIQFSIGDDQELMDQARRSAVQDARRKAQLFAEASDVRLGAVIEIRETPSDGPRPMPMQRYQMAEAAQVPIARGELTLTAQVHITYALQD